MRRLKGNNLQADARHHLGKVVRGLEGNYGKWGFVIGGFVWKCKRFCLPSSRHLGDDFK